MRDQRHRGTIRLTLATIIALATGLVGLAGVVSDLGPGETILRRAAAVIVIDAVAAGLVGWLARKRWPLALLVCWGPSAIALLRLLRDGLVEPLIVAAGLLVLPAACLAAGRAGSWLGGWRAQEREPDTKDHG